MTGPDRLSLTAELRAALELATGGGVRDARQVGGGDINDAWVVTLDSGQQTFVKTRPGAPRGEYATEAAGLRWLAEPSALSVPRVVAVVDPPERDGGQRLLALELIERGRLDRAGEEELGRGLALIHLAGAAHFGATPPGAPPPESGGAPALRLGAVLLPNDPLPTWPAFYAQCRLRPLAAMARNRRALSAEGVRAVEAVCERIEDLAGPPEPPARLHGDLWSGNVLAGADGRPWLIDPAAYGGHREVDLAMLVLFGAPAPRTLAAYREAHPLADGHEQRVELYQLLPLLVHAVLFGGSYGASATAVARRYAG